MTRIPFDPDAIRALAAVLNETGLTEIEIAEKDSRIRVVRAVSSPVAAAASGKTAATSGTRGSDLHASHPRASGTQA